LQTVLKALKTSKENISIVLEKTIFWDKHKQIILNKLLDIGEEIFIGGINTRKYASMTKTSTATASRELKNLVEKKCLVQNEGTAGRNISYKIFIQK